MQKQHLKENIDDYINLVILEIKSNLCPARCLELSEWTSPLTETVGLSVPHNTYTDIWNVLLSSSSLHLHEP